MAANEAQYAADDAAAEQAFISMLQHAERYLELHEAARLSLKRGWFNMARARHSMGLHQVSAAMYSSHMEAQARVLPSPSADRAGQTSVGSADGDMTTAASSDQSTATAAFFLEADASSAHADMLASAAAAPEGGMRNAAVGANAESGNGTSEAAAHVEGLSHQLQHLPLGGSSISGGSVTADSSGELCLASGDTGGAMRMFGATPSPHLRQSQADFAEALRQLVAVANQQRELSRACGIWEATL